MSIANTILTLGTLLASFPAALNAQTNVAGSTPASFRVTESGAAEYRIPIRVPPGVAGMEPRLGLAYNSQAGNGLVGMGWHLEGFSAITRCPKSVAQDGVRGGVNYDANDRYCLDGQRLVAISGNYGADGADYRTERESFSKVISYGTAGSGPAWFKVWTKSGQILEYGSSADSQIEAQGKTTVRVWALNKISDTKGNYLTVSYTEDSANGDYYPSRVDYTGNSAAGLSPTASVQFVYQERTDVVPFHVAGSVMKPMKRLTNVKTYVGATLVKDYRLAYDNNGAMARSRLLSITECESSGQCLSAVNLAWQAGPSILGAAQGGQLMAGSLGSYSTYSRLVADLNGDGKTDVVALYTGPSGVWVYTALSNGDGTFGAPQGAQLSSLDFGPDPYDGTYSRLVGDLNGDGMADVIVMYTGPSGIWVYTALGKGDGTFYPMQGGQLMAGGFGYYSSYSRLVGDLNGDGRSDLVALHTGPTGVWAYTAIGNGDGTFGPVQGGQLISGDFGGDPYNGAYTRLLGDLNGDGMADVTVMGTGSTGIYAYTALGKGDGTFYPMQGGQLLAGDFGDYSTYSRLTGDLNGDGRTDLVALYVGPSGVYAYAAIGKGDGTFGPVQGGQLIAGDYGPIGAYERLLGDMNGDGKADVVALYTGTSGMYAYTALGKGDGTFGVVQGGQLLSGSLGSYDAYSRLVVDANGDGKADLLAMYTGPSGMYTYGSMNIPDFPDLLVSITNSLGAVTSIIHRPLTDAAVYVKDTNAVYPTVDLQIPMYVAYSASATNGIGGTVTTNYKYTGAKAHQQGGGYLGFRKLEATDAQTGIKTATTFRQDHPFQGLPTLAERNQSSGALLNRVTNTWTDNPAYNALPYPNPPSSGKYHRSDLTQAVEVGNDLNGAALPTVTTSSLYDAYGNASSVTVTTGDGYSKATSSVFNNDTSNWFLGRLKSSTVTSTMP